MLIGDLVYSSLHTKEDYMRYKLVKYNKSDCPLSHAVMDCMKVFKMHTKVMLLRDSGDFSLRDVNRNVKTFPVVYLLIDKQGLVYDLLLGYYGITYEDWCNRSHFLCTSDLDNVLSSTFINIKEFKRVLSKMKS